MLSHVGIVAVTSLALEARIAQGSGVSVLCRQSLRLATALKDAIARGASGVISFGVAGGLAPKLAAGDWIVASHVRTDTDLIATDQAWAKTLLNAIPNAIHAEIVGIDTLLDDPAEKARVHVETGAVAVDMESHVAAKIALEHRIPFAACRIIIDAAHRRLPPAAAVGLRPDGTPDLLAVCRSVLQNPRQLPDLIRTALDARIAQRALRLGRKHLGAGLGFPNYNNLALTVAVNANARTAFLKSGSFAA